LIPEVDLVLLFLVLVVFFDQDFLQIGPGKGFVYITGNQFVVLGYGPINGIDKGGEHIDPGQPIVMEKVFEVVQKVPTAHPLHDQVQKDKVRELVSFLQMIEAQLYPLLSTGTGQDVKIPLGLLYTVPGRKLGHQIIVYYTGGQFHL